MTSKNAIAETIVNQLGGNMMTAMIGVKHMTADEYGVGIRFAAKAANKINHIQITLDQSDTYTVEFWQIGRGAAMRLVAEVEGVYADSLRALVERQTGLCLSL